MMETPSKYQSSRYEKIKKYIPFAFLFILTVLLMLFFRYNKQSITKLIEKGKQNLLSIYANNLRPLFTDTQFSEEELFNFALYQSLPLDRDKNKVLILSNEKGLPVYQISSSAMTKSTQNYETFTHYLGMSKIEKEKTDSILNSYRKQIYTSILVSDKNAYAVNPNIANIQKALLADIVSYAQKINLEKTQRLFPAEFNFSDKSLNSIISIAKEKPSNEYLLITPDTVAEAGLSFDERKWEEQLRAYEVGKEFASQNTKLKHFNWEVNSEELPHQDTKSKIPLIDFTTDSNISRIKLSGESLARMINDSLRIKLEEVAKKFKTISLNSHFSKDSKRGKGVSQIGFVAPIPDPAEIIKIINPGEITSQALKLVGNLNIPKLIEERMKYDTAFKNAMKDTAKSLKIREKLKELNRKIKRMNRGIDTLKH